MYLDLSFFESKIFISVNACRVRRVKHFCCLKVPGPVTLQIGDAKPAGVLNKRQNKM